MVSRKWLAFLALSFLAYPYNVAINCPEETAVKFSKAYNCCIAGLLRLGVGAARFGSSVGLFNPFGLQLLCL